MALAASVEACAFVACIDLVVCGSISAYSRWLEKRLARHGGADRRTLADEAGTRISEDIITGRYGPGEKLTLLGLQASLSTSSTPIRDAIARLASEHVLDFAPSRHSGREHLVRLIEGLRLRTAPCIRHLFPGYAARERGRLRAMPFDAIEAGEVRSARAFVEADVTGAMDYIIAERSRMAAGGRRRSAAGASGLAR